MSGWFHIMKRNAIFDKLVNAFAKSNILLQCSDFLLDRNVVSVIIAIPIQINVINALH